MRQHLCAGRGQPGQAFAGAHEELDAELVLELADLTADAGLRRMQRLRHIREVEVAADGFSDGAELLEIHDQILCGAARRRASRAGLDAGW